MKNRYNNNSKKKKWRKRAIIISIILLIIMVLGAIVEGFISSKLSNVTFLSLDKDELDVNSELYDLVSDTLTKKEFKNIKNIVLFGIDSMNPEFDGDEGRSDSIIIVSINPKYDSIKFISIPRDTYAEVDGIRKNKDKSCLFFWERAIGNKNNKLKF